MWTPPVEADGTEQTGADLGAAFRGPLQLLDRQPSWVTVAGEQSHELVPLGSQSSRGS